MAEFNDSSTGYVGNLPESKQEAREDGVLNSYAHMYDVIKEDKYRQRAISEEAATRKSKDAVLQANITKEANAREEADKVLQDKIDKINVISPQNVEVPASGDGPTSVAIGNNASVNKEKAIAIGESSKSEGVGSIAIGVLSSATGVSSISIGPSAKATGIGSVAIGSGSKATETNVFSVGGFYSYDKRRIVNALPPKDDNDVATKGYVDALVPSTELLSYLKTLPDIEFGYSDVGTIAAGGFKTVDITFSSTKTEAPSVFANVCVNADGVALVAYVKYSTTTGATLAVSNLGSSEVQNVTVDWFVLSGR